MLVGQAPAMLLVGGNRKSAGAADMTMAITRTAEETKRHYIAKMGEELGSLYYALWQEVVWLHVEWAEYVELYGTKPSRIALLNEAAPSFFRLVQDGLFETAVLKIARLTDPPKSVGKPNLTVQQLPALITDEQLRDKMNVSIEAAKTAAAFCRDWRNRRFAHRDLYLSLGLASEPLETGNSQEDSSFHRNTREVTQSREYSLSG
jgi:AbiU2